MSPIIEGKTYEECLEKMRAMTMNPLDSRDYEAYQKKMKEKEAMDTQYAEMKEKCEEMEQFIRDASMTFDDMRRHMLNEDYIGMAYHVGKLAILFGLCVHHLDEYNKHEEPLTP